MSKGPYEALRRALGTRQPQRGIRAAIELPHLVNRFGTYDLEAGSDAETMKTGLENIGYEVNIRDLNSGLHGISISEEGLEGGADPRREGVVIAQ